MSGKPQHGFELRQSAVELYEKDLGCASIASMLGIPEETVRKWLDVYRFVGIEVLVMMGAKKTVHSFGTKVAAVRAVTDVGMPKRRSRRSSV